MWCLPGLGGMRMWEDRVSYLQGTEVRPGDIGNRGYRCQQFAWEKWIVMSRGRKVHWQCHVEGQSEDRQVPFAEHGVQCAWENWTENNRTEGKNMHVITKWKDMHAFVKPGWQMESPCCGGASFHWQIVPKVCWQTFYRKNKNKNKTTKAKHTWNKSCHRIILAQIKKSTHSLFGLWKIMLWHCSQWVINLAFENIFEVFDI